MNVTNLISKQYECYKLDKQTIWMFQTCWTNNMNVTNLINKQYECYKLDKQTIWMSQTW